MRKYSMCYQQIACRQSLQSYVAIILTVIALQQDSLRSWAVTYAKYDNISQTV